MSFRVDYGVFLVGFLGVVVFIGCVLFVTEGVLGGFVIAVDLVL